MTKYRRSVCISEGLKDVIDSNILLFFWLGEVLKKVRVIPLFTVLINLINIDVSLTPVVSRLLVFQ